VTEPGALALAALAALALLVGCSTDKSPATTHRSTDSSAELTRAETIAWARAIDPCALLDRDLLGKLGSDVTVGTSGRSTDCSASVETGSGTTLTVNLAIAFLPNDFRTSSLGEFITLDGVDALRINAVDTLPEGQRAQLVVGSCSYDLAFEHSIAVRMRVSAPRDQDACAPAEKIAKQVIATWPARPPQGTSPDTVVTALTAAEPCAVVPKLRQKHDVKFEWPEQSLNGCFLTLDGSEVLVSYDYRPTALPPGEHEQIVGAEFTAMVAGRKGPVVPVIDVSTESASAATEVLTAAAQTLAR